MSRAEQIIEQIIEQTKEEGGLKADVVNFWLEIEPLDNETKRLVRKYFFG